MLLDEPFGALDPLTRDRLQQSFLRIRRAARPHGDLRDARHGRGALLGDRIAVLHEGRLVQVGTPRELLRARRRLRAPADRDAAAPGARSSTRCSRTAPRERAARAPAGLPDRAPPAHARWRCCVGSRFSVPLGVLVTRRRAARAPVLGVGQRHPDDPEPRAARDHGAGSSRPLGLHEHRLPARRSSGSRSTACCRSCATPSPGSPASTRR